MILCQNSVVQHMAVAALPQQRELPNRFTVSSNHTGNRSSLISYCGVFTREEKKSVPELGTSLPDSSQIRSRMSWREICAFLLIPDELPSHPAF